MKLTDRLRAREIVRTNPLGAETTFAVGNTVHVNGTTYRVTRHKTRLTTPWATVIVYGVRT